MLGAAKLALGAGLLALGAAPAAAAEDRSAAADAGEATYMRTERREYCNIPMDVLDVGKDFTVGKMLGAGATAQVFLMSYKGASTPDAFDTRSVLGSVSRLVPPRPPAIFLSFVALFLMLRCLLQSHSLRQDSRSEAGESARQKRSVQSHVQRTARSSPASRFDSSPILGVLACR